MFYSRKAASLPASRLYNGTSSAVEVRNEMAVVTIEMADATGTPFKRGLSTE